MRRYDVPVVVRVAGRGAGLSTGSPAGRGEPAEFRWRGRHYRVRVVLAQWVEVAPWWRGPQAVALRAGVDPAAAPDRVEHDRLDPDRVEHDRWVWRVEASPVGASRGRPVGVFDLRVDDATGRWSLLRVLD